MAVDKISKIKNIDNRVKIFFPYFHVPSGHMLHVALYKPIKEWGRHKTHKLVEKDMVFQKKINSQCKIEMKAEIDLMLIDHFILLTRILWF